MLVSTQFISQPEAPAKRAKLVCVIQRQEELTISSDEHAPTLLTPYEVEQLCIGVGGTSVRYPDWVFNVRALDKYQQALK